MNKYQGLLAIGVGIGVWLIFVMLLPWFTYSRAYAVIAGMIFVGATLTVCLAFRARSSEEVNHGVRSATFFGKGLVYLLSVWVGSWLAVTVCLRDKTLV